MKKVRAKTIEKITHHMHDIFDASNKALQNRTMVDSFSVDLIKDTKKHLEILNKYAVHAEIDQEGHIREIIKAYIELKFDIVDEIIALELLVYDKKKKYQELLIKSNREYAKLGRSTENPALRKELKKSLADEIYNSKNYLDELVSIADTKRGILLRKMSEAQNKNREIVELLEKEFKRNVFTDIVTGKFAFIH